MELFDSTEFPDNDSHKAFTAITGLMEKLDEISPNARDNAAHALLYGFSEHSPVNPPYGAIHRFLQKTVNAQEGKTASEEGRRLAEQIRTDRLDPDTEQVQAAAFKVVREFDRLRGLLRFKPEPGRSRVAGPPENYEPGVDKDRCYTARCAPDHFVLPLLGDHFWRRFGEQSWAIIDEKRNLILSSNNGKKPILHKHGNNLKQKKSSDQLEDLWKNYFRSINNEERSNPGLQKQFLPDRYRKYLTEME